MENEGAAGSAQRAPGAVYASVPAASATHHDVEAEIADLQRKKIKMERKCVCARMRTVARSRARDLPPGARRPSRRAPRACVPAHPTLARLLTVPPAPGSAVCAIGSTSRASSAAGTAAAARHRTAPLPPPKPRRPRPRTRRPCGAGPVVCAQKLSPPARCLRRPAAAGAQAPVGGRLRCNMARSKCALVVVCVCVYVCVCVCGCVCVCV